jgi:hypothetical protein
MLAARARMIFRKPRAGMPWTCSLPPVRTEKGRDLAHSVELGSIRDIVVVAIFKPSWPSK